MILLIKYIPQYRYLTWWWNKSDKRTMTNVREKSVKSFITAIFLHYFAGSKFLRKQKGGRDAEEE